MVKELIWVTGEGPVVPTAVTLSEFAIHTSLTPPIILQAPAALCPYKIDEHAIWLYLVFLLI
jgi:hypothetical protein